MRLIKDVESLYIDFDAFFANVEKQLHPDIRDKPVGVTALDSEYSAFITRCYMAKAVGIKRGMRVRDARALCPDLIVRVARPDLYVDIHNKILDEIDRFVPVRKVSSIDEMECDLIGAERRDCVDLAKRIRAGLAQNIGPYVTPSIGLAANGFLAKVAAEMNKPNGLTVLDPKDMPGPILHLKLTDLPGISGNMEKRLNAAGVWSIEEFWNVSSKQARAIWGNIEGERLWAQLRGYEVVRPETQKRMFGHSRVLTQGWRTPDKALECLNLLTVKAAYRLRRAGYICRRLSVSFKLGDGSRFSGEADFLPCSDDRTLLKHMHIVFERGLETLGPKADLKSVYIMLHNISRPHTLSGDLFSETKESTEVRRWDRIMETMDGLNKKHGQAVLHVGSRANLPGGFAGGKIAFGRVPSKEDFF